MDACHLAYGTLHASAIRMEHNTPCQCETLHPGTVLRHSLRDTEEGSGQTIGCTASFRHDEGKTPASGDKHDYMSQARYFWPDPAKPDGLPYINRDGISNPELNNWTATVWEQPPTASPPWHLAWYFSEEEKYARKLLSLSVYGFWTKPPG